MAYSIDFRKQVLLIKEEEKLSLEQVAKRFGIGVASVFRWSKRIAPQMTRNKSTIKMDWKALAFDVEVHPDSYQYERAARFGVSQSGIAYALKRLKLSRKKKVSNIPKPIPKSKKYSKPP